MFLDDSKKKEIIDSFEKYFNVNEELSNEEEEAIVKDLMSKFLPNHISLDEANEEMDDIYEDMDDELKDINKKYEDKNDTEEDSNDDKNAEENDKEDKNKKSLWKKTTEKSKEIAKAKGKTITKYIHKTLHFKEDELANETMPRKVLRVAISAALIIGPWFLPYGGVVKLIGSLTGAVIANAISIKKKKDLIDLYEVKLEQVNKKIDETDDDKEIYELKKIKKQLETDLVKVKKSLNAGGVAYEDEKRL